MKIQKIVDSYRNDFNAILECEHCYSTQRLYSGYNDKHYHAKVLPAITCVKCGKNRAGDSPAIKNDDGFISVP